MPFYSYGNRSPSQANRNTDILGSKGIGGVGQLVYHPFRFCSYHFDYDQNVYCAFPFCDEEHAPKLNDSDFITGKELLVRLCNLAKQIDDVNNSKPYADQIVKWCSENVHPYNIDVIYQQLIDPSFDVNGFDAELVARDGIFSVDQFMKDLGDLYVTVLYYEALEGICVADEDMAYNLYKEGKYFEGLPFFERYKGNPTYIPNIDVSSANGKIVEEMKLYAEYEKNHPTSIPEKGQFGTEPYDDYEQLRDTLIERIPDFKMHLKVNPATNRMEFSADVHSIFDIAWFTLARMISEDPAPEEKGTEQETLDGILICCKHCGDFLIQRNGRQEYCDKPECQKARNAKNQREYRKRKRIEKAQMERINK